MLCDSHVHVVADVADAPMVAGRTYTPGVAGLGALRAGAEAAGVRRFVVVQPSFYGTDNTVTAGAARALGEAGRAVAVVDPARVGPAELEGLHRDGVRGLRINLYSSMAAGAPPLEAVFDAVAGVAARMGWHVEVLAAASVLMGNAGMLAGSAAPVVIDHYGLLEGGADGRGLLTLLGNDHVWMKLSAPYRSVANPLAVRPDPAWLRALLDCGTERLVWGSDWPHTPPHEGQTGGGVPLPYRALDYGDVVAGFREAVGDAVGDAAVSDAIMGGNAARLYGFGA